MNETKGKEKKETQKKKEIDDDNDDMDIFVNLIQEMKDIRMKFFKIKKIESIPWK